MFSKPIIIQSDDCVSERKPVIVECLVGENRKYYELELIDVRMRPIPMFSSEMLSLIRRLEREENESHTNQDSDS